MFCDKLLKYLAKRKGIILVCYHNRGYVISPGSCDLNAATVVGLLYVYMEGETDIGGLFGCFFLGFS